MIFTETVLPSAADTQGSHTPNVTAPAFSTAPRVPSGSRFSGMASEGLPLDAAEQYAARMSLEPDVAWFLRGGRQSPPWGLWITGEVEPVHNLTVQADRQVGSVDRDLVGVP